MDIHTRDTAEAAARFAAEIIAKAAEAAVNERGVFHIAVSGGHTPWPMFKRLRSDDTFPWESTVFYQVDERIVPRTSPDRNLAHLIESLPDNATIRPLPVDDENLDEACDRYGASLPVAFDVIHLGLGPDGHTASLVPGDSVLKVRDRLVALTGSEYQGHRRMTLTYPALARTRMVLWLVAGGDKWPAVSKLLAGDPGIPAGVVDAPHPVLVGDKAALGQ